MSRYQMRQRLISVGDDYHATVNDQRRKATRPSEEAT
jgi:hypothetical protein